MINCEAESGYRGVLRLSADVALAARCPSTLPKCQPVTQSDDPLEVVVRGFWKHFPTAVVAPAIPFLHPPSPRDALESAFEGAGNVERVERTYHKPTHPIELQSRYGSILATQETCDSHAKCQVDPFP